MASTTMQFWDCFMMAMMTEDKARLIQKMRETAWEMEVEGMRLSLSGRALMLTRAAQLLLDADEFERKFEPPIVISFVTGQNQIPLAYPII